MSPNRLLDRVRSLVGGPTREISISYSDAVETFREERGQSIEDARVRAGELIAETDAHLDDLAAGLEAVPHYLEESDLDVLRPAIENFHDSRARQIEQFDPPSDIEAHHEELTAFLNRFSDVSNKQAQILQTLEDDEAQFSTALTDMLQHRQTIETFLEEDWQVITHLHDIEATIEEITSIEEEIESTRETLETIDIATREAELEDAKAALESLEDSDELERYQSLEADLEDLERERAETRRDLSETIQELERGLKKLRYAIDSDSVAFEGDLETLEHLIDTDLEELEALEPTLMAASETIEAEELLEGRQREKFETAADRLVELAPLDEHLSAYEEDIEEVRSELDAMDVPEQRAELEARIETARDNLEQAKDRQATISATLKDLQTERQSAIDSLESNLNEYLDADVTIEEASDGQS